MFRFGFQVYSGFVNVTHLSLESRKRLEHRVRKNTVSGHGYGVQLPVAIKVLHPEIAESFARDLNLLKSMVAFLSVLFPSLEWLSLKESINEFASLMETQVKNKCYSTETCQVSLNRPHRKICKCYATVSSALLKCASLVVVTLQPDFRTVER